MNALWDHYWPAITVALVIGAFVGTIAFRASLETRVRRISTKRTIALMVGIAVVLALTALWHGPLGASRRFAAHVEGEARQILHDYEMIDVRAQLKHAPLRRTLVLAGPADDFQRSELVRILDAAPGVANVHWAGAPETARLRLPLLAEAKLSALAGLGLGLVLSYLLELRRRSRTEWRW